MPLTKSAPTFSFQIEGNNYPLGKSTKTKPILRTASGDYPSFDLNSLSNSKIQMLPEMMVWDWGVQSEGQTTQAQWNFCDKIPQSTESGSFIQTGQSFSQNYLTFLDLIDPQKFQALSVLKETQEINKPPTQYSAKKGWTTVTFTSEPNIPERSWAVSTNSYQWKNSTYTGSKASLTINNSPVILNSTDVNGNETKQTIDDKFSIQAEKWGIVTISPSIWYNGSIVILAKSNQNVYKQGITNDVIFGDNGMIRSRVASFIVALNPSISIQPELAPDSINNISKGSIESLGMKFGNITKPSFDSTVSSKINTSGKLTINAEASKSNQAYIIAACIEDI